MSSVLILKRFWVVLALLIAVLVSSGCNRSPEARSAIYIEAGKKLLQKKDPARAILEFLSATKTTPNNAEAHYQLGLAYLVAGDLRGGVSSLRRAVELNPKHSAAQLRLAQLMASVNEPDILKDAQQRLQGLLQESPDNPYALHALALTDLKLGAVGDAVQLLERAIVAQPEHLVLAATLAKAKFSQNDFKGAENVLREACQKSPKSADAQTLLGRFYASQNRAADAEQQFQRALAIDPGSAAALFNISMLQSQMGRKQEAEQNFKRLSGLSGKTFKPIHALFLFQEGRREEAIREFERLAREDPGDRTARTRLVMAYRSVNRAADAERILEQALKKNSRDLDALLQRGELFLAAGKYPQAEADMNQVIHFQSDSAEAHYVLAKLHQARNADAVYRQELSKALQLNGFLVSVRLELAQALIAGNNAIAALDLLDAAPDSQKQLTPVQVQRNWGYWTLGDMAKMRKGIDLGLARERSADLLIQDGLWKLRAGNATGSRASLEEALKMDPADLRALQVLGQSYVAQKNSPMGLQKVKEYAARQPNSAPMQDFLGVALMAQGDRTQARAAFQAAKAADPRFVQADLSLAQLDAMEGKLDDARKRLEAVLATNKVDSTSRLWLGNLEEMKGNHTAAIDHFRKVVEASPGNAQALNNLAYLLSEYGKQPDEALKHAQKAVEIAPGQPAYCDTLGWILYRKGLYAPAIQYLERASSNPENVAWKYHLAMAYAKAGDRKRGRTTLEAALKLDSKVPEARIAQEVVGGAQ